MGAVPTLQLPQRALKLRNSLGTEPSKAPASPSFKSSSIAVQPTMAIRNGSTFRSSPKTLCILCRSTPVTLQEGRLRALVPKNVEEALAEQLDGTFAGRRRDRRRKRGRA